MSDGPEVIDVMAALRSDGAKVKAASGELWKAMLTFDGGVDENGEIVKGIRNEYQEAYDRELIQFEDECLGLAAEVAPRKLPAADIREARVRARVQAKHPELYMNFLARDAQITALKQTISNRKASIGAWQSILRGERE